MRDNLHLFKKGNGEAHDVVKEVIEESKQPPMTRSEFIFQYFGQWTGLPTLGEKKLNLGCGATQRLQGFDNLDRVDYVDAPVDIVADLELTPLMDYKTDGNGVLLEANTYDVILASHVLEHIRNLPSLMREIHRLLKPNGFLCVVCPYASSDDAWEDPTHVRAFTENSWMYFDRRTYEQGDHAGRYASGVDYVFDMVRTDLQPTVLAMDMVKRVGPDKLPQMIKQYRNMISEMFVTLKAVKEV